MKLKQKLQYLHGFTLVELMIVTVVLAILAGVSVVGYGAWRQSIAQKEVQTDLQTAAVSMASSRNFNDEYPTSIPPSFKSSPNVQLTYTTGSATGYCIEGISTTNSNIKYYISSNGKVPIAGTCAGISLVDESGSGTTTGPSCNSGDVLSGTTCTHTYAATYESGGYSCPSGGTISGTTCTVSTAASYSSGGGYYGCPSGGSLSGSSCITSSSYAATATTSEQCPSGTSWIPGANYPICTGYVDPVTVTTYSCPSGGSLSGSTCYTSSSYSATYYSYSGYYYCSGGATLNGSTCTTTYTATQGGGAYTCPSGGTLSGTTCTQTYTAS